MSRKSIRVPLFGCFRLEMTIGNGCEGFYSDKRYLMVSESRKLQSHAKRKYREQNYLHKTVELVIKIVPNQTDQLITMFVCWQESFKYLSYVMKGRMTD